MRSQLKLLSYVTLVLQKHSRFAFIHRRTHLSLQGFYVSLVEIPALRVLVQQK